MELGLGAGRFGAMTTHSSHSHRSDGFLSGLVRRAAGASARRPRRTIALWLLLVVGCLVAGSMTGTQSLNSSGTGESKRADDRISAAGLEERASESVLVRSSSAHETGAAARRLESRLRPVKQ